MKNITALITTFNSERRLDECLSSLSFCEKILVVDSYSTDATEEICKRHKVNFIQNPFIRLEEQFLFALKHIDTDWVIILDSDEICSSELQNSILAFFNNAERATQNEYDAAYLPRSSYFFHKFLKHSDSYPDYLMRLFRKDMLIITSSGVHQVLSTQGRTTHLKGDIIHYPYTSFKHQMKKLNAYADYGAKEKTAQGQEFSLSRAILHSIWGFLRIYFYKKGFLDGKAGFILATHHAFYVYMKYIRIGENSSTFGLEHENNYTNKD